MEKSRKRLFGYGLAIALMVLGFVLNQYNVGIRELVTFGSVGNWLIFMGLVAVFATTLRSVLRKKKVVDERMEFVAAKATRITFLLFVAGAFAIMLIDGIRPITLPYFLFMSYLLCALIIVYGAAYYLLLERS